LKPDKAIFGGTAFSKEVICGWTKEKSAGIVNLEITVHSVDE
jgi:hypothetical protein